MSSATLRLDRAGRRYGTLTALTPTSLDMERGTVVLVEGDNGSGKSTLLRLAAGLLRPSTGSRECAGPALYLRPDGGGRATERVRDAIGFAAALRGTVRGERHALEAVGLGALGHRPVASLSSGQRARLMLAYLRVVGPALVCLDEPTAHLDAAGTQLVIDHVGAAAAHGASVLLATHDSRPFLPVADATLVLEAGHVRERGAPPQSSRPVEA